MEQENWVQSEWSVSESNHRMRLYSLTVAGHRQLIEEEHRWDRLIAGVKEVLRFA